MSGANLPPLKTRKLGRTNVGVTELGLGTAPLGELFDKVEDDEAAGIIAAAWDGGVRYFDTSPWYGRGLAEHSLGRALYRKPRDHYVISTKIGRVLRRPFGPNAIKDQWLAASSFRRFSTTATTASCARSRTASSVSGSIGSTSF
jgi:D-threo-aldose 1-dehydrogenase